MKKIMKILGLTIFTIIIVCGTSFLTDKSSYSNWEIKNTSQTISWAKFEWTNEKLGDKHFEKTAMFIPCKIEGIENPVTFQFDLGSDLTGVYENTYKSFYKQTPELEQKIKRYKSVFQFWNNKKSFKNLNIQFGNYSASNESAFVFENYGDKIEINNSKDTIHIGTIGADIFKNRVLIIDYPKKQFAICEKIPEIYKPKFVDIELDRQGRIILPMIIKNKNYRIMFDNGSSIFPIITDAKNISNFSTSADIDTIQVSSWGQQHGVTGKMITDTFELAGQKFGNVKVYANHKGLGIDHKTDGMTGNALFWDKTIIIDFKNKKFGVQ